MAAVEFVEQRMARLVAFELRVGDAGAHLDVVQQFDARHRNARLDGQNDGVHRRLQGRVRADGGGDRLRRSEEHTSELQSLMRISYAVFCLKKKKKSIKQKIILANLKYGHK